MPVCPHCGKEIETLVKEEEWVERTLLVTGYKSQPVEVSREAKGRTVYKCPACGADLPFEGCDAMDFLKGEDLHGFPHNCKYCQHLVDKGLTVGDRYVCELYLPHEHCGMFKLDSHILEAIQGNEKG